VSGAAKLNEEAALGFGWVRSGQTMPGGRHWSSDLGGSSKGAFVHHLCQQGKEEERKTGSKKRDFKPFGGGGTYILGNKGTLKRTNCDGKLKENLKRLMNRR